MVVLGAFRDFSKFTGNPYDGHVLSAQLEQTRNLLQDLGRAPKQAIVDLGTNDLPSPLVLLARAQTSRIIFFHQPQSAQNTGS